MYKSAKQKQNLRKAINRGLTIRKIPYNVKAPERALDYLKNYKPYAQKGVYDGKGKQL